MNEIIKRIDAILSSDGWKRTTMLQILRDELVEKRDAALKAKELPVIGTEKETIPEKIKIVGQETLKVEIKDGEVKTEWVENGIKEPSKEEMIEEGKALSEEHFPEA